MAMEGNAARRLLVTGGSGFLGWNLCSLAASSGGWNVYAAYLHHAVAPSGCIPGRVDLTSYAELRAALDAIRPDAVVHCAAASQPNWCQEHPAESRRINVEATVNIAGLCADRGIPLAFTSTDLVFDGRNSPYKESDPVSPVSLYAEQKVEAETGVMERHPAAAVCRMPLMYGVPGPAAQSFVQPFLKVIREGKELRLFTDEFRTPVSGRAAAAGLLMALEKVQGLIHLGGRERVSRYEMGRILVEALEIPNARITPCLQSDVPMSAPRPKDVSLDSAKAFELGYEPPEIRGEIARMRVEL